MAQLLGSTFQKAVEIISPIVIREVSKPRFRRFLEEKAQDVAIEIARRVTTKKSKKNIIIRKGKTKFTCRRMN